MTATRYMPLLFAAFSALLGYTGRPFLFVVVLAFVSMLIVSGDRMRQVRQTPHRVGKPNVFAEGAYLFVLQVLILGLAWSLGYFMGFKVGV